MAKKIIGYGNFFCWNCGNRIEKRKKTCPNCGSIYSGDGKYGNVQALGAGGIGLSLIHIFMQNGFSSFLIPFLSPCP